ncbi:putative RNA pseudouridylate synthase domain-containing protein [Neospora caninum Liverpool]|uniref:Putative RNA pseudouridylate synthase domain-containing protein n=1 Tax=Neospora caninum (strain Liverpool) TaxID=572307 RepID=F0VP42_NEOCL|nr:putative RNA pseudouridylate synthase domain-containing protein [Neospora caninum Liverpool]CBZ55488.1 putative RNA pseudouridylate synthase domain-containing protein [Neospora caninum Liverpool]CEL70224.1 TPA: RNA pseudouridylate synthase domain-containing protein, putative [Neospora caninum Liverpool]|eukprot:XP_003885516.1 putative RNA pseudouridylate synthase domain-containing protein [Neospora caninum Liverpool]
MFVRGTRHFASSCASLPPSFSGDRREADDLWARDAPRDCFFDGAVRERDGEAERDRELVREKEREREGVFAGPERQQGASLPVPGGQAPPFPVPSVSVEDFPPRAASSPTSSCGRPFHASLHPGDRPDFEGLGRICQEERGESGVPRGSYANFCAADRVPFPSCLPDGDRERVSPGSGRRDEDRGFLGTDRARGAFCGGGGEPAGLFVRHERADGPMRDATEERKERHDFPLAFTSPFPHHYPAPQFGPGSDGEVHSGVYLHPDFRKSQDGEMSESRKENLHAFHAQHDAFPEDDRRRHGNSADDCVRGFPPFLGGKGFEGEGRQADQRLALLSDGDREAFHKRGFFVEGPARREDPFAAHPYPHGAHFDAVPQQREAPPNAHGSPPSSPFLPAFPPSVAEENRPLPPIFPALRQGEGDGRDAARPPGAHDPRSLVPSSYFFSQGNLVHAPPDGDSHGKMSREGRDEGARAPSACHADVPEQRFAYPSEPAAFNGSRVHPPLSSPPASNGGPLCGSSFYPPQGPMQPFFEGPFPASSSVYQGRPVEGGVYDRGEGREGDDVQREGFRVHVHFHRPGEDGERESTERERPFFISPPAFGAAWNREGEKRDEGREGNAERERESGVAFPPDLQGNMPENERFDARRFPPHALEGSAPIPFLVGSAPSSPSLPSRALPPAFGCSSGEPALFPASPLLQPPLHGPDVRGPRADMDEKPARSRDLEPNYFGHERDRKGPFLGVAPPLGPGPQGPDCAQKCAAFQETGPSPQSVGFNGPFRPLHVKADPLPLLGHPASCASTVTGQPDSCESAPEGGFFSTASAFRGQAEAGRGEESSRSSPEDAVSKDSRGSADTRREGDCEGVVTLPATNRYSPVLHPTGPVRLDELGEPGSVGSGKREDPERRLREGDREYRMQREKEERDLILRQCFFSEPSSPLDRQRNNAYSSTSAFLPPSFSSSQPSFTSSFLGFSGCSKGSEGRGPPLCNRPVGPGGLRGEETDSLGDREGRFRDRSENRESSTGLLPLPFSSPARHPPTSPGGSGSPPTQRGCLGPGAFSSAYLARLTFASAERGRDEDREKGEGRGSPSSLLGSRPDQAAPFLRIFEEPDRRRQEEGRGGHGAEEGLKGEAREEWRRRGPGPLERCGDKERGASGESQKSGEAKSAEEREDSRRRATEAPTSRGTTPSRQEGSRDGPEDETASRPGAWNAQRQEENRGRQGEGLSSCNECGDGLGRVEPREETDASSRDLTAASRRGSVEAAPVEPESPAGMWRASEGDAGKRPRQQGSDENKPEVKGAASGPPPGKTPPRRVSRSRAEEQGEKNGSSFPPLLKAGEPRESRDRSPALKPPQKESADANGREDGSLVKSSSAALLSSQGPVTEPLISGRSSVTVSLSYAFSSRHREPFSISTSIAAMASPLPPPPGANSTYLNNARAWGMLSGASPSNGDTGSGNPRRPSSGTPRFSSSSSPPSGSTRERDGAPKSQTSAAQPADACGTGDTGTSQHSSSRTRTPGAAPSSREASGGRSRGQSSSGAASGSFGGEAAASALGSFFASPAPKKAAGRESREAALRSALGGASALSSTSTVPSGPEGDGEPEAPAASSASAERWRVFSYAEVCSRGSGGGARAAGSRTGTASHASGAFSSRAQAAPDLGRAKREGEAGKPASAVSAAGSQTEKAGDDGPGGASRASSLLDSSLAASRQGRREENKSLMRGADREKGREARDKGLAVSSRQGTSGGGAGKEETEGAKAKEGVDADGEKKTGSGSQRDASKAPFASTLPGSRMPAISSNSASLIMDFPASSSGGNSLFSRLSQASSAPGGSGSKPESASSTAGGAGVATSGKGNTAKEEGEKNGKGAPSSSTGGEANAGNANSDCSDEEEEVITLLPKELASPKKEPDVLWEGDGLTVIDKPPGWHCSDVRYDPQTESRQLCSIVSSSRPEPLGLYCSLRFNYPTGKLKECNFGLGHRLDVDTSGPIIIAQTLEAWQWIRDQMHKRNISKEYICLCHGTLAEGFHVIDSPIITSTDGRRLQSYIHHAGQPSLTVVKPLAHLEHKELRYPASSVPLQFTLNWVKIHTGRTHQIRVHLQSLLDSHGRPHCLVSDDKYGNGQQVEDFQWCRRLFLHQHRLSFRDLNDTPQCFVSPLRADLLSALRHLRVVRSMHEAWHPLRDHLLLGPGQGPQGGSTTRTSSRSGEASAAERADAAAGRTAGPASGDAKPAEKLEIHVVLSDAEQRAYDAACRAMQQHNQEYRRSVSSRCCFSSPASSGAGALGTTPYGSLVGGALQVSLSGGLLLGSKAGAGLASSALCGPPLLKVGAGALKNVSNSAPLVPLLPPISTAMLGAAGSPFHAHHSLMLNHKGVLGTPGGPSAVALRQQARVGTVLGAVNAGALSSAGLMASTGVSAGTEDGRDSGAGIYGRSNSGTMGLPLAGALGAGSTGGAGSSRASNPAWSFADASSAAGAGGDSSPSSGTGAGGNAREAPSGSKAEGDGATQDGPGLDWKLVKSQASLSSASSAGTASASGETTPGNRSSQGSLGGAGVSGPPQNTSRSLLGTGGASRFFGSAANTPPSARSLAFAGRVPTSAGPGLGSTAVGASSRPLPVALDAMVLGGPRSSSSHASASNAGNAKSSTGNKDSGFFRSFRGDSSRTEAEGHRLGAAGSGSINRAGPSPSDHQLFSSLGRTSSLGARGDKSAGPGGASGDAPEKGDGGEGKADGQGPSNGDTTPGASRAGTRPASIGPRRQLYKEVLVRSNKGGESGSS